MARQENRLAATTKTQSGERSLWLWPVLRDLENWRIKANTVKSVIFKTHPPANTYTPGN